MGLFWIMIAGCGIFVALSMRELLFDRKTRAVIFCVAAVLGGAGLIITAFTWKKPALFPSLLNPLVSLGLFVAMHRAFERWQGRDPVDTFMNWKSGLAPDRLFNILYAFLSVGLLMVLYVAADLTGYDWY